MLQDAIYWQPHFGEDISSEVDGVLREKLTPGLQYLAEKLRLKVETDPKKLRQIVAKQAAHSKRPGKMSRKTIPDPPEMAAEFAHYPVVSILDNPPRSRGFALIFSITRFADPSIKPRVGGNIDADNLEKTFTQLGYDVLVYRDDQCTAMGIEVIFENIKRMYCMASKYPPQHDSFICCISSHGVKETGEEFIVPYDYNVADVQPRVHLAKLSHMINAHNCPVLAAKPKLFFIQACRGVELPGMVRANVADSNTETDDTEEIHEDSDFLFSYSTRVSNKSVRDKLAGSWYIQELCQLLQSDAAKRKDICTLITEVHRRVVANHKDHFQGTWFRQCPEVTHTLRLLFYFYKQEF